MERQSSSNDEIEDIMVCYVPGRGTMVRLNDLFRIMNNNMAVVKDEWDDKKQKEGAISVLKSIKRQLEALS